MNEFIYLLNQKNWPDIHENNKIKQIVLNILSLNQNVNDDTEILTLFTLHASGIIIIFVSSPSHFHHYLLHTAFFINLSFTLLYYIKELSEPKYFPEMKYLSLPFG